MFGKGSRNGGTAGFDGSEIDPLAECDELQCKPGWDGDPYNCQDVDECYENLHEVSYFVLGGFKYDSIKIKITHIINSILIKTWCLLNAI